MNTEDYLGNNENPEENEETPKKQREIIRNDYGDTKESTVVIEEEDRTVILTDDETIVMEKAETIDIAPSDRPRKVYGGMWGTAEILTVSLALLAVLTVVLLHVFLVLPAQSELEANRKDRDKIEIDLDTMRGKYGKMEDTETEAAKLIRSVYDFESRFLRTAPEGKTALYQRLNGLMNAYGLENTSGPDYIPLEIADLNQGEQRTEQDRGRDRFLSLFPGVFVTVTVEGSYQNLRRFMSEVENSSEFITITSVELVPAEKEKKDSNSSQPNNTGQPGIIETSATAQRANRNRGKTRGEIVSLKLEMVSYFRRPDFQPLEPIVVVDEQ